MRNRNGRLNETYSYECGREEDHGHNGDDMHGCCLDSRLVGHDLHVVRRDTAGLLEALADVELPILKNAVVLYTRKISMPLPSGRDAPFPSNCPCMETYERISFGEEGAQALQLGAPCLESLAQRLDLSQELDQGITILSAAFFDVLKHLQVAVEKPLTEVVMYLLKDRDVEC